MNETLSDEEVKSLYLKLEVYENITRGEFRKALNTIEALKAENQKLEQRVYVPGVFRCAKCELRTVNSSINLSGSNRGEE